ncbi:MAG: hypothetical protein ABSD58_04285 [Verrucomicrobiia bacterium]|jgi:hypothetical protein
MFAKGLNGLAERKLLVVLEGGLHRGLIELECASLRVRLESARTSIRAGSSPWLIAGGAVAGLLAARHRRGLATWVPTALLAWRWVQRLKCEMMEGVFGPRKTWKDPAAYDHPKARDLLARRFGKNFKEYAHDVQIEIRDAGPRV